jgi:hypothetical protein
MKPSKVFYAMLIAACAACFGAGYSLKKVTTVFVDVPRTETDTLYVEVEKMVYTHLPAKHDTIWQDLVVSVHDTLYAPIDVASIDTVLQAGGVKYGDLLVAYYLPPADWFNMDFQPAPLPTITVTKYIDKKRPWYVHPAITAASGAIVGITAANAIK